MNLVIITGGSSGLGYELIRTSLNSGYTVINISRTKPDINSSKLKHYKIDFSKPEVVDKKLDVLESVNLKNFQNIYLINNAGTVNPIGRLHQISSNDIIDAVNVNLISPFIVSKKLLAATKRNKKCKIKIVNIVSGASFKPIDGWSVYCSSKAGLKMFSDCLAQELDLMKAKAQVVAISPGVIDTPMQAQIRKTSARKFSNVKKFKDYKNKNQLRSAQLVSQTIFDFMVSKSFSENHYSLEQIESLE